VSHVPGHGLSHGQPFQPMVGGGGSGISQGNILNPLQQYTATPANVQGMLPSLISSATSAGGGRDGGGGMGARPFGNQSATQSMHYVSGGHGYLGGRSGW
jgi:hypothetical protein